MPITRLTKDSPFQPEEIRLLVTAFEAACSASGILVASDPRRDIIAQRIIEAAQGGERDLMRLRECGMMAAKQSN
jgi:hypothetical protein